MLRECEIGFLQRGAATALVSIALARVIIKKRTCICVGGCRCGGGGGGGGWVGWLV